MSLISRGSVNKMKAEFRGLRSLLPSKMTVEGFLEESYDLIKDAIDNKGYGLDQIVTIIENEAPGAIPGPHPAEKLAAILDEIEKKISKKVAASRPKNSKRGRKKSATHSSPSTSSSPSAPLGT